MTEHSKHAGVGVTYTVLQMVGSVDNPFRTTGIFQPAPAAISQVAAAGGCSGN